MASGANIFGKEGHASVALLVSGLGSPQLRQWILSLLIFELQTKVCYIHNGHLWHGILDSDDGGRVDHHIVAVGHGYVRYLSKSLVSMSTVSRLMMFPNVYFPTGFLQDECYQSGSRLV